MTEDKCSMNPPHIHSDGDSVSVCQRTADQRIKELEQALNSALAFFHPSYERPEAARAYCEAFYVLFGKYPPAWEKLKHE